MADGRNLLVAMFQGGGTISQILLIVARLVTLGHRVRVLVGPGVRRTRLPASESFAIRAAIQQVLTTPSFRQEAQRLANAMAREDGVRTAVEELESVVGLQ